MVNIISNGGLETYSSQIVSFFAILRIWLTSSRIVLPKSFGTGGARVSSCVPDQRSCAACYSHIQPRGKCFARFPTVDARIYIWFKPPVCKATQTIVRIVSTTTIVAKLLNLLSKACAEINPVHLHFVFRGNEKSLSKSVICHNPAVGHQTCVYNCARDFR